MSGATTQQKVAAVSGSSKGQQSAATGASQQQHGKFIPLSHINRMSAHEEEEEEHPPDLTSITSKGSDRRKSMQLNITKSCNASFSPDDWLVVLAAAGMATMTVFAVMCALLHGDGKRQMTASRMYNISMLMTGCLTLTVQLLMLCMYGFQWWTGV